MSHTAPAPPQSDGQILISCPLELGVHFVGGTTPHLSYLPSLWAAPICLNSPIRPSFFSFDFQLSRTLCLPSLAALPKEPFGSVNCSPWSSLGY